MKLWEMRYGDEPVSGRMFALRFMKKIHIVIITVILAAAAVCALHLVYRLSQVRMYMTEADVYLEYIPEAGSNELIYFNKYTWEQMSKDSAVIGEILLADPGLDADTVRESFLATLDSDVKVLTLRVQNPDPAMSERIMKASLAGIDAYACSLPEILSTRVIGEPDSAKLVPPDIRVLRAVILGAFFGLFFSVLYVSCSVLSDDRIILPETIEKRYHLPAAGTLTSANLSESLEDLSGDEGFTVASALPEERISAVIDELKKAGAKPESAFLGLSDTESKGLIETIGKCDKPVVYIFSSKEDVRKDERALSLLSKCGKEPMCAVLADSDDGLIRAYYAGKRSRFADDAKNKK
ncbi:MAG: hypothetical protein IKI46_03105 [Lachnospiraceae bacterium]|nr:hypothetical protein [Lachnospiraceae bacterium]